MNWGLETRPSAATIRELSNEENRMPSELRELGDVVIVELPIPGKLATLSRWFGWAVAIAWCYGLGIPLVFSILYVGVAETKEIVPSLLRLSGYCFLVSVPFALAWAITAATDNYRRKVAELTFKQFCTACALLVGMAVIFAASLLWGVVPLAGYVFANDQFRGEFVIVEKNGRGIAVSHVNKATREEVLIRSVSHYLKRSVGDEVCIIGRRWVPGVVIIDAYHILAEMPHKGEECRSE